jgi:hypothetical protein
MPHAPPKPVSRSRREAFCQTCSASFRERSCDAIASPAASSLARLIQRPEDGCENVSCRRRVLLASCRWVASEETFVLSARTARCSSLNGSLQWGDKSWAPASQSIDLLVSEPWCRGSSVTCRPSQGIEHPSDASRIVGPGAKPQTSRSFAVGRRTQSDSANYNNVMLRRRRITSWLALWAVVLYGLVPEFAVFLGQSVVPASCLTGAAHGCSCTPRTQLLNACCCKDAGAARADCQLASLPCDGVPDDQGTLWTASHPVVLAPASRFQHAVRGACLRSSLRLLLSCVVIDLPTPPPQHRAAA